MKYLYPVSLLVACSTAVLLQQSYKTSHETLPTGLSLSEELQSPFFRALERMEMEGDLEPSPDPEMSISTPLEEMYVIDSSVQGFVLTLGSGLSVTKGTAAELTFSITLSALQASDLAKNDKRFIQSIEKGPERRSYFSLRERYEGGLDIPFLSWIGANLTKNVELSDLKLSSTMQGNYEEKTEAASSILLSQKEDTITLSGSRVITGTSFIPSTVYAYVNVARIVLPDGSKTQVVSTISKDIMFAKADGTVVARGADKLEVTIQ